MMNSETAAREITNSRTFAHPQEQVFNAFADERLLTQWWGPKGFNNTFQTFDFCVGGTWSFVMHSPDGQDFKNECVFQEIVSPSWIVIAHVTAPKYLLEVTLEEVSSGTLLTWTQRFETAEMRDRILKIAGPANEELLDRLEAVLTKD